MNVQATLTSLALMGAEWVMWLLIGLSIMAVAVIIERALFFLTSRGDASLSRRLQEHLDAGDWSGALQILESTAGFESRIAVAALEQRREGNLEGRGAEQRVAAARLSSQQLMQRRLAFLGTLGNNAPFVGLLGTVIGIITAFRELAAGQGQVSAGLMAEIGEALVVTGLGLLVALPAVASFNLFQQVIRGRVERGDALAHRIVAAMQAEGGDAEHGRGEA